MYFHWPLTVSGSLGFRGEADDEVVGPLLLDEIVELVVPLAAPDIEAEVPVVVTLPPVDVEPPLVLVLVGVEDVDVLVRAFRDA